MTRANRAQSGLMFALFGSLVLASTSAPIHADQSAETVQWNRAPISLSLPIGKERYIWFPGRVQPGLPPDLVKKLTVQVVNDTIYLKATEAFETTRLPVRDLNDGDFYLFDIQTDEDAPATPLRLVDGTGQDGLSLDEQAQVQTAKGIGYVALTRFAAQRVYAPKRLVKDKAGISKVPMPVDQEPLPGLYDGRDIETTPIASWRGDELYVTAVAVSNRSKEEVTLDPRRARGSWLTAAFHHPVLGPDGSPGARSTLYLISDRPFLEVIDQWRG